MWCSLAVISISYTAVRCIFSFNWVFHVSGNGECPIFSSTTFVAICTYLFLSLLDILFLSWYWVLPHCKEAERKTSLHKFPHFITCWLQFTPNIFTGVIVLFTLCLAQACPQCIMFPGSLSVSLVLNISFWFLNNPPNLLCLVFIGLLVPLQVVHIFNTILFIACTPFYLLA